MQSVRQSPKLIHYRVRSAAELTNEPALKEAISAVISDIYGDSMDDAEMFQQLTQTYYSLKVQVDGLAIPSGGVRSVSYSECHYVEITYTDWTEEVISCPNGEFVVGIKSYRRTVDIHRGRGYSRDSYPTHVKCCKASISV